MLSDFFAPLINKIFAGVVLALLVALGIALWSNARKDDKIEALRNTIAVSEAQHSVTAASLDALTRRMQQLVDEGKLRQSLLEDAMKDAEAEAEDLQDEADALRKEGVVDQCVTPAGVLRSKGL